MRQCAKCLTAVAYYAIIIKSNLFAFAGRIHFKAISVIHTTSRLDALMQKFRARGGRVTPQRMAILKALLAADHPTIKQIYEVVRHDFPMTSEVTVYRTLALLRDAGEVLEVNPGDAVARYDGLRPNQHPHLMCNKCGRIVDSPELDVRALVAEVERRAGDWALSEEVLFYGVCPECQAKKNPQA